MSQHDMNIANQGFPAFRSDLNDALSALATTSAGTAEPSTTFANQLWYDSTNDLLKMRNSDNDAWITLAYFDQTADEWQIRSAAIQAVDAAGVQIKTDEGTTRIDIQDDGDVSIDSGTLFVDAANNRVGVGTTTPNSYDSAFNQLVVANASASAGITIATPNTSYGRIAWADGTTGNEQYRGSITYNHSDDGMRFNTANAEAMRIDSSNNVLIGKTSYNTATQGFQASSTGQVHIGQDGGAALYVNRNTNDGNVVVVRKSGANIGLIGVNGGNNLYISSAAGDHAGLEFSFNTALPLRGGGTSDNTVDLGSSSVRFDDVYATNGTIQTSDEREKQDVAELSEAERNVAVAAKGLLRKYRWINAVEEKGDDARIHFGIIAQDLKAAFEAEGLDAGRYAMFIQSEWWETSTDVPAVQAQDAVYETQTDEEGNETQVLISEAVEAKEAHTRIDTYETEAEAPEGAIKKDRMGIRYPELLAFIIAAI